MQQCPTYEQLRQVILSDGDATLESESLHEHLLECEACRAALDEVSDDPELVAWKGALVGIDRSTREFSIQLVDRILRDSPTTRTVIRADGSTDTHAAALPDSLHAAGARFGDFEIVEEIGRGGMAIVYKARDLRLNRLVAIKFVPCTDMDEKSRVRFVREAQAAARVKHDHVVTIHGVESASDGSPYLVMEFIAGPSLQTFLRRGPMPVKLAAEFLAQAALGLHAIHEANLVHCDIKPSNIMIEESRTGPRAKVTDFGLARLVLSDRKLTFEAIGGTPQYMSPEQLQSKQELDRRSDVYSLGVTFYEALTGVVPFSGSPHVVIRQIEHVEPRHPTALNPEIPRDAETICLKAMAKESSRRYASALEFAEDVQRWLRGEPILARPAGAAERMVRWCRRNPRIAALSSTVLGLLLVVTVGSIASALRIAGEQAKTKKEQLAAQAAEQNAKQQAFAAQQARSLAEQNANHARQQRNLAIEAHVNLVGGVHDRLADTPGTLQLRKELLETAVTGLEKIVGESSTADDADHTLFLAHQRLGEAFIVLGRTEDAARELTLAHRIAKTLHERHPANIATQDDLASAWTSLAEFHIKSLDYVTAQRELQQAFELIDAIGAQRADDAELNFRRIRILSGLGDAALRLNEIAKGEEYFQTALILSEPLRASNQLTPHSRRVIESILRRLGDAALLRGEMGKGVDFYQRAVQSAEEAGLAKLSLLERHGLIDAYGRLGLVLVWLGEADASEQYLDKGLKLNEQAAQVEPENLLLKRKSAVFLQRLSDVSWSRGDYETMRTRLQKSLDVHSQLSERDPSSQLTQNDLVICWEQFARLEVRLEKYREAAAWYEKMQRVLTARKEAGTLKDPVSINFEQSSAAARDVLVHLPEALQAATLPEGVTSLTQAGILLERATVFARQGRTEQARECLGQASPVIERLTAQEQSALHLVVARVHALCARSLQESKSPQELSENERSEIQACKDQGLAALEKFVAVDPFNATYLGFEFELQALRDDPRFQQLLARFRGPKSPN